VKDEKTSLGSGSTIEAEHALDEVGVIVQVSSEVRRAGLDRGAPVAAERHLERKVEGVRRLLGVVDVAPAVPGVVGGLDQPAGGLLTLARSALDSPRVVLVRMSIESVSGGAGGSAAGRGCRPGSRHPGSEPTDLVRVQGDDLLGRPIE
jgi:hypothetical protein